VVGFEKDAKNDDSRMAARKELLAQGKCSADEFYAAVSQSGDAYFMQLTADLAAAASSVQALESFCDEKFGRDAPSFAILKKALEDLQEVVHEVWKPAEEKQSESESQATTEQPDEVFSEQVSSSLTGPVRKRAAVSEEPLDLDDAVRRMVGLTRYLRLANPANPVPYLVLRGLRWGELRAAGSTVDPSVLDAPLSVTRQQLIKLSTDGQWNELLEGAEAAMALPCGRGWLDLQRYTVRACEGLGHEAVASAVCGELRALLKDYPDLAAASLSDGTQAAHKETQAWISECILPPPAPTEPEIVVAPHPSPSAAVPGNNGSATPDAHELAQQAVRSGRIQDAVEILSREIAQERSGRARFHRKIQLAALCLSAKHEAIAYPILAEIAEEIDRRKLEEWEESSALAQPLALLFRCMNKLGYDEAAKQKIYQKICRLDPVQIFSGMR
jgi:type VI secretion system protein ImpA